jgi:hypothetical protein
MASSLAAYVLFYLITLSPKNIVLTSAPVRQVCAVSIVGRRILCCGLNGEGHAGDRDGHFAQLSAKASHLYATICFADGDCGDCNRIPAPMMGVIKECIRTANPEDKTV